MTGDINGDNKTFLLNNEPQKKSTAVCSVCGGDLGKGDKFCFVCGTKVEPVSGQQKDEPVSMQSDSTTDDEQTVSLLFQPKQTDNPVPDLPYDPALQQVTPLHEPYETGWEQGYQRPERTGGKKNPTPVFIGIAAVLAIAVGAGIYMLFGPFNKNDDANDPDDTEPDPYTQQEDKPAADPAPEVIQDPPVSGPAPKPTPGSKPENENGGENDFTDDPSIIDPPEPADDNWDKPFILDFSSSRAITDDDLKDLSLAELRFARNEIYARHGRLFSCQMLDDWFNSKEWYVSIPTKQTPVAFDRQSPSPLSRTESSNVSKIINREDYLERNEKIFPLASTVMFTIHDVSLRRDLLQKGLSEIYSNAGVSPGDKEALSDVERHNVDLIEYALSLPEIRY